MVSSQTQQLSAAAYQGYEDLVQQVTVQQDGYVTVYVGNESEVDVYFDDVTVEHRQGLQVQETEYDPAGMQLAGLGTTSPGLRQLNQYQWNGKEFQADLGLNWTALDWRTFDPQLNRMPVVDPEVENGQESMSPYAFGFDNAMRYNDPDGRCPDCPVAPSPEVLQQVGAATSAVVTAAAEAVGAVVGGVSAGAVAGAVAVAGAFVMAGYTYTHPEEFGGAGRPAYMTGQPNGPTFRATDQNGRVNANSSQPSSSPKSDAPGRNGAFKEAKRDAKVPRSQQPEKVEKVPMRQGEHEGGKTVLGKDGKPIQTREYTYKTTEGKTVIIQDHGAGHEKGGQGPHFNVRPPDNPRTGSVDGTQGHYPW